MPSCFFSSEPSALRDTSLYEAYEEIAYARIPSRDVEGWPVVGTVLLLDCPIWTEDQDFLGSGVATWTTNRLGFACLPY